MRANPAEDFAVVTGCVCVCVCVWVRGWRIPHMGCVNLPVRPGVVCATHARQRTHTEEELMFLRRGSLEDDVICSHWSFSIYYLESFFFSFFFKQTRTTQTGARDIDGWRWDAEERRRDERSKAKGRRRKTAGGGKGQPASGCAINYKAAAWLLGSRLILE